MIPSVLLTSLDSLNQKEIQIMGETLKVMFDNKETRYPFNDSNKMFGGDDGLWSRSDILHYFNQIDFDINREMCLELMGIFATIIVSRQFK